MTDVRTNNHWREIEFTMNEDTLEEEAAVMFKGEYLFLSDFMRFDSPDAGDGWHGYFGTSYFSAYLIKLHDDGDAAIIGEQFS